MEESRCARTVQQECEVGNFRKITSVYANIVWDLKMVRLMNAIVIFKLKEWIRNEPRYFWRSIYGEIWWSSSNFEIATAKFDSKKIVNSKIHKYLKCFPKDIQSNRCVWVAWECDAGQKCCRNGMPWIIFAGYVSQWTWTQLKWHAAISFNQKKSSFILLNIDSKFVFTRKRAAKPPINVPNFKVFVLWNTDLNCVFHGCFEVILSLTKLRVICKIEWATIYSNCLIQKWVSILSIPQWIKEIRLTK